LKFIFAARILEYMKPAEGARPMKRRFVGPLAIVAVSALSLPALAAEAVEPNAQQVMESVQNGSQHWAADRQMMLDAKLAGMKAELKLKPDQEKLWTPFETAVRDSAKDRMENMQKMMEMRKQNEQASPIDLLDTWSSDLTQAGANMKKVAEAAKPLYASLDETQKHDFTMLGRMLMPERARFAMEMMRHRWNEREKHE
jgi:LTXXQ motif family protein